VYLEAMRRTTWWRTPVGVGSPVFGRGRRPSSRRSVAEARWCQSPRFSASLIGLKVRVCGGAVDTVNVGFRTPAKPLFYMALREGDTATNGRRPQSGRVWDRDPATGSDPEIIPGDHIPTQPIMCTIYTTFISIYIWSKRMYASMAKRLFSFVHT
jgi:hypothetical protein